MKDRASIDDLAALARLSFEGEERAQMAADLESIMKLMDTVAKVELLQAREPMTAVGGMELLREDLPAASMPGEALLSNAKESEPPFFAVQKLID